MREPKKHRLYNRLLSLIYYDNVREACGWESEVRVIPFEPSHLSAEYVSWLNDREVTQYSEQRHRTHTIETCYAYWQQTIGEGDLVMAVEVVEGACWVHIGNITVSIDQPNGVAELSIIIGKRGARGKGAGAYAWSLASLFALRAYGLRKIIAGTMAANAPMRRVIEKTNMYEVARIPGRFLLEGGESDLILAEGTVEGFRRFIEDYNSPLKSRQNQHS